MVDELRLPPEKPVGELKWIGGGEIDEYCLSLRFFGETLDPDRVSQLLGHSPTSSCRQGDIFRGKLHDRIEKQGRWIWTTERFSEDSLEIGINSMLDELTSDLQIWNELTSQYYSDMVCGLFLKRWNRDAFLSPITLGRLTRRGLILHFDFYFELEEQSQKSSSTPQGDEDEEEVCLSSSILFKIKNRTSPFF